MPAQEPGPRRPPSNHETGKFRRPRGLARPSRRQGKIVRSSPYGFFGEALPKRSKLQSWRRRLPFCLRIGSFDCAPRLPNREKDKLPQGAFRPRGRTNPNGRRKQQRSGCRRARSQRSIAPHRPWTIDSLATRGDRDALSRDLRASRGWDGTNEFGGPVAQREPPSLRDRRILSRRTAINDLARHHASRRSRCGSRACSFASRRRNRNLLNGETTRPKRRVDRLDQFDGIARARHGRRSGVLRRCC